MGDHWANSKVDSGRNSWDDSGFRRSDAAVANLSWPMIALHRLDAIMLRYSWIATWTLFAALLIVAAQALDRKPPFAMIHVFPAQASPGEKITIHAQVWRDGSRSCAVTMGRSVFDSERVRFDFPVTAFSARTIGAMEERTPGRMAVSFVVPDGAAPGPAELVSALEYRCNQAHTIWPIEVTTHVPFTILP